MHPLEEKLLHTDTVAAGSGTFTMNPRRRKQVYEPINRQAPYAFMVQLLKSLVALGATNLECQVAEDLHFQIGGLRDLQPVDLEHTAVFLNRGTPPDNASMGLRLLHHACLLLSCRRDLQMELTLNLGGMLLVDSRSSKFQPAAAHNHDGGTLTIRRVGSGASVIQATADLLGLKRWRLGGRWPEWCTALAMWPFPPIPVQWSGSPVSHRDHHRQSLARGGIVAEDAAANGLLIALPDERTCSVFRRNDGTPVWVDGRDFVRVASVWQIATAGGGPGRLLCCAYGFVLNSLPRYHSALTVALDMTDAPTDASGLNFVTSPGFDDDIDELDEQVASGISEAREWFASRRRGGDILEAVLFQMTDAR